MRKVCLSVLCFFCFSHLSPGSSEVFQFLSSSLETYQKQHMLQTQADEVLFPIDLQIQSYQASLRQLEEPPLTQDQVDEYQREILSLKGRADQLEHLIQASYITSEKQKKAAKKEWSEKIRELEEAKKEALKPLEKQEEEFRALNREKNEYFKNFLSLFFLVPKDKNSAFPEINHTTLKPSYSDAQITCQWKDKNNNQIAWAILRIRIPPHFSKETPQFKKLAYITFQSDSTLWLWVNHFNIVLVLNKQGEESEERLLKAAEELINLPGLARMKIDDGSS